MPDVNDKVLLRAYVKYKYVDKGEKTRMSILIVRSNSIFAQLTKSVVNQFRKLETLYKQVQIKTRKIADKDKNFDIKETLDDNENIQPTIVVK